MLLTSEFSCSTRINQVFVQVYLIYSQYRNLAKDENVQVRKAVATNLKFLILQIPKYPETEAVSLLQLFSKDEQDIVRFLCVDNLLALGQVIPYQVLTFVSTLII